MKPRPATRSGHEQRPGPHPAARACPAGPGARRGPCRGGGRLPGARAAGGGGGDRGRPGVVHARHQAGGVPGSGADPGQDVVDLGPRPAPGAAELPDRPAPGEPGRFGDRRPRAAGLAGAEDLAGAAAAGRRLGGGPAVPPAGRWALLGGRRVAAAATYVANPYVVVAGATTPVLVPYALLPWLLLALARAVRDRRRGAGRPPSPWCSSS